MAGIVFDLAAVTFIDNAALGVIVGTYARLRPVGGRVAVTGAAPPVARLLQAVGCPRSCSCFPARQEAVIFLQVNGGGNDGGLHARSRG